MKRIKGVNILLTLLICLFFTTHSKSINNKIIIKVDNEIITTIDLLNEIEYLKILNSKLSNLPDKNLFDIGKKSLIREKIRKAETDNFFEEPEIEDKYFEPYLNEIMKKSNFQSIDQLNEKLHLKGLDMKMLKKKIKIEILWNQLILNKFSNKVKIDRNKIKNDILESNEQKKYYLSEIIFNINNDKNEKLDEKYIKIKNEITKSGFENAASIYSISDSANTGGKIGWINFNSLSETIKREIIKIKKNQYTKPIVIPGGFLILKIDEEETVKIVEDIQSEVENISRTIKNKQLNQYSNIYFNKLKKEFQIDEL